MLGCARSSAPPTIVNLYGITETTVHSTFRVLEAADLAGPATAPIGREMPHGRVVLRDAEHRRVADGEEGEMWVCGPSVALG